MVGADYSQISTADVALDEVDISVDGDQSNADVFKTSTVFRVALFSSLVCHAVAIGWFSYWLAQAADSTSRQLTFQLFLNPNSSESNSRDSGVVQERESPDFLADNPIADNAVKIDPAGDGVPELTEKKSEVIPVSENSRLSDHTLLSTDVDVAPVSAVFVSKPVSPGALSSFIATLNSNKATRTVSDSVPMSAQQKAELERQLDEWQDNFGELIKKQKAERWESDNQLYVATFESLEPVDAMGLERAKLTVTTTIDNQLVTTTMQLKRLAFSSYAQLVNRWDPDVVMSQDEIDGRFHSNSKLMLDSRQDFQPKFFGHVTVSSRVIFQGRLNRDQIFQGGLDSFVNKIELPNELVMLKTKSEATLPEQLIAFQTNTSIVFYDDGSYRWQALDQTDQGGSGVLHPRGQYFIAGDNVELQVKGVVHGNVVVYSPEKITIVGDLTYQNNPLDYPDSKDFIGLLSDKYVEVAHPDVVGSGDLNIHAAIYAKRRFLVRRFNSQNNGEMTIVGSVTAGSLSATEPRYATRIRFDPRFENNRPLSFPMTNHFELESWESEWNISPEILSAAQYP